MSDDIAPLFPPERAALFEHMVEATAPPPEEPLRCSCNWCLYGARPTLSLPPEATS